MYMVVINLKGFILSYTDETRDFLGYNKEEMEDMGVLDLVNEKQLTFIIEGLKNKTGIGSCDPFDLTIAKKDGSWVDVHVSLEVVPENGNVTSLICRFQPV